MNNDLDRSSDSSSQSGQVNSGDREKSSGASNRRIQTFKLGGRTLVKVGSFIAGID
jgi:hypothetical protein